MELIKKENYEVLTQQEIEIIKQFKELEAKFDEIRKEKRQYLIDYLKSKDVSYINVDNVKITLKKGYTKHLFDSKRFKDEKPKMYEKYLKESNVDESVAIEVIYE